MSKMSKNQKGFSTVEVILVIVIVALIGTVGWLVYKNHHKTTALNTSTTSSKATTKSTVANNTKTVATANSYAGWKSYSNSQVSFQYPADWTASNGPGDSQSTVADATSSTYTSSATTTATNPGASIDLYLQISSDSSTIDCADAPCTVTAVSPLSNSQLPNSVLAFVNQTSGNGTKFTEYVVASNITKVGDTTINAIKAGSSGLYVFGQPEYNTNGQGVTQYEAASVSNVSAFQADSHYTDLVSLINSIKFN